MKALALSLMLVSASAAAENYTESIPVLGPGELPPVGSILREQIVDWSGKVDRIFKYAGQNWRCLGTDGDTNNAANYPGVVLVDLGRMGPHTGGFMTPMDPAVYPHLGQVIAGKPFDWPVCSQQGGDCEHIFWMSKVPSHMLTWVQSGDVLAWVVLQNGQNCTGVDEMAVAPDGTKSLVNTGGELVLGIHVEP